MWASQVMGLGHRAGLDKRRRCAGSRLERRVSARLKHDKPLTQSPNGAGA